jgi:hypothetical protein
MFRTRSINDKVAARRLAGHHDRQMRYRVTHAVAFLHQRMLTFGIIGVTSVVGFGGQTLSNTNPLTREQGTAILLVKTDASSRHPIRFRRQQSAPKPMVVDRDCAAACSRQRL